MCLLLRLTLLALLLLLATVSAGPIENDELSDYEKTCRLHEKAIYNIGRFMNSGMPGNVKQETPCIPENVVVRRSWYV